MTNFNVVVEPFEATLFQRYAPWTGFLVVPFFWLRLLGNRKSVFLHQELEKLQQSFRGEHQK